MTENWSYGKAMDWYSEAIGELKAKIAETQIQRDAPGVTQGQAYFMSLNERRLKRELTKLLESRARLAKYYGVQNANA